MLKSFAKPEKLTMPVDALFPSHALKKWFLKGRRAFPWRDEISPYRVWISEVMLQQTRAEVVIPYFNRWMAHFPTIEALAHAPEEEVVKMWEGLGYYSRARNLHYGAHQILQDYNGIIPDTLDALLTIKGIGRYTAGAILSFAYQQKAAAADANVLRVMGRYLAIEKPILNAKTEIEEALLQLLPDSEPSIAMEALIELGATLCNKKPLCDLCPLQSSCLAHHQNMTHLLPIVRPRAKTIDLYRFVACIQHEGHFLVKKNEKGSLMADLFEFPYIEEETDKPLSLIQKLFERSLGLFLELNSPLKSVKQHFTKYRAHLTPFLFTAEEKSHPPGYQWVTLQEARNLPFSSGHKKILQAL